MKTDSKDSQEIALCEINKHGRLLSANHRFCRMFGFHAEDIPWHYMNDLYRYEEDWKNYCDMPSFSGDCRFITRLRNRRGRSFKCLILRTVIQNEDGQVIYRNQIEKVSEVSADIKKPGALSVVSFPKKQTADWAYQEAL
ncbi:MAG: PAS domain-containing protein [Fibrobacter sp.]|jgi:PAS domain S-box-containing protein|nr:PAS domain-containing protein [Fibrobacter sp.]